MAEVHGEPGFEIHGLEWLEWLGMEFRRQAHMAVHEPRNTVDVSLRPREDPAHSTDPRTRLAVFIGAGKGDTYTCTCTPCLSEWSEAPFRSSIGALERSEGAPTLCGG
jgi:hypothetical protein